MSSRTALLESLKAERAAHFTPAKVQERRIHGTLWLSVICFVLWIATFWTLKSEDVVIIPHTAYDEIDESVYEERQASANAGQLHSLFGWGAIAFGLLSLWLYRGLSSIEASTFGLSGAGEQKHSTVQQGSSVTLPGSQLPSAQGFAPSHVKVDPFKSFGSVLAGAPKETRRTLVVDGYQNRGAGAQMPIRTQQDLDELFRNEERRMQARQPERPYDHGSPHLMRNEYMTSTVAGGMRVQFATAQREKESAVAADTEWTSLGIRDVDSATLRIAEWVNKTIQQLLQEIADVNRWFAEKQLSAFDCNNSLRDTFVVPAPPAAPAVSWAAPAATNTQNAVTKIKKIECLTNEKAKLVAQQPTSETYNIIMMFDRRIALETVLDLSETFPTTGSGRHHQGGGITTESDATRCQSYIIRRLKTLGSQPTLSGYRASSGEPEVWSEDYPCDAHLLIHILSMRHPALIRTKLPHQPLQDRREMVIYVGHVGEPYFFVKYRENGAEKVFHTRQGNSSLFQALLICVALITKYHDRKWGSVFGVINLEQVGLPDDKLEQMGLRPSRLPL
jgi:hypothetical protein